MGGGLMSECVVALFRAAEIRRTLIRAVVAVTATGGLGFESVFGQVPQSLNGAPVQVQPYVPEPGVPLITITTGTPNPFPIGDATASGGDVSGNGGDGTGITDGAGIGGDGNGGAETGSGTGGSSTALSTMLAQSWGAVAVANTQVLGVNASAIAATCLLESGCQNIAAASGSTVSGAFQMTNATYTSDINAVLAGNPSLWSQLTPGLAGKMDPATEAVAAAQDLKTAATSLQSSGISNPTVLDTRGYYNFGGRYGATLAQASDDQNMSSLLPTYSSSQLAANGITPTTTVGQWRQSIIAKIGNAANQPVLSS
jgi:hypothetical protein